MVQMNGMSRDTGKKLRGFDHLRQSVHDILSTPIGTRVMRRDYGSDLPGLVDRPMNAELVARLYAATAGALHRWEPRLRLRRVVADWSRYQDGIVGLTLVGWYVPEGREITLDDVVLELRRLKS